MSNKNKFHTEYFEQEIIEFITLLALFAAIIVRICTYDNATCSWIWIINYIGMSWAIISLLIKKCIKLNKKEHEKLKPLIGLTICIVFILFILFFLAKGLQTESLAAVTNNVITLLALFFSLSGRMWNIILNIIIKIIK